MSGYTPGPWSPYRVGGPGDYDIVARREGGGSISIATVDCNDGHDEPTWLPAEANARLIAAAPTMADALGAPQWAEIDAAIDRYVRGEISELVALGLITKHLEVIDGLRRAALRAVEGGDND